MTFVAGLGIGLAIGLPVAHAVVDLVLLRPTGPPASSPPASPTPGPGRTPTAAPSPSPTARPSATPVPLAVPVCAPLAAGQAPLAALAPPPSGYRASAALDWLGCGDEVLPRQPSLSLSGAWLLAISFTCPPVSRASASPSGSPSAAPPTLAVQERAATGSASQPLAALPGDSGESVVSGAAAGALPSGGRLLDVTAPPACLWHLAVYRSTAGR